MAGASALGLSVAGVWAAGVSVAGASAAGLSVAGVWAVGAQPAGAAVEGLSVAGAPTAGLSVAEVGAAGAQAAGAPPALGAAGVVELLGSWSGPSAAGCELAPVGVLSVMMSLSQYTSSPIQQQVP